MSVLIMILFVGLLLVCAVIWCAHMGLKLNNRPAGLWASIKDAWETLVLQKK